MSAKKFRWAGHDFLEVIEQRQRKVILRLKDEEFVAPSEQFLREEAAAAILKNEKVQERLTKC
jgi:hypothetical protein